MALEYCGSTVGCRLESSLDVLIKSRTCADIHVFLPISVPAQSDWFNSTDSGGQYYLRKTSTQTESDWICNTRLRPGGDSLQISPHRHTRQVRVLLQGTRHQPHEVSQRGKSLSTCSWLHLGSSPR